MKFAELPIGARFRWQGKTWTKIALSMADDENRQANSKPHRGGPTNHKSRKRSSPIGQLNRGGLGKRYLTGRISFPISSFGTSDDLERTLSSRVSHKRVLLSWIHSGPSQ